jgi:hypothetical protein
MAETARADQEPVGTNAGTERTRTVSSGFDWVQMLFFYSAVMWTAWGVSRRLDSTWPVFVLTIFVFVFAMRKRVYGPKVTTTFLTSPVLRVVLAVFAAIHATVLPLIARWD